jgi:hypothetical protein
MSEAIEDLKALREIQKEEKWKQYHETLDILQRVDGLGFEVVNANLGHVRVEGHFDFWPTTGKWVSKRIGKKGIGLGELFKAIEEDL